MVKIKSDGHQCHQKQNNKDNNNEREQLNRHRTSEFNKPPSTRDVQSIYNCTRKGHDLMVVVVVVVVLVNQNPLWLRIWRQLSPSPRKFSLLVVAL